MIGIFVPYCLLWDRLHSFPPVSLALLILVANLPSVSTRQGGKLSSVSMTPVANLPPLSFSPVANNESHYQSAKNEFEKKLIYMLTLLLKGIKLFLIEEFFQKVINGQSWSFKSSEFQFFFSEGKYWFRMLIFLNGPISTDFNPQKRKPAIFLCGPHQLIVNSRQSSQNVKNGWCRFLPH